MIGGVGKSAVYELESCGSTNKEAMRLALSGEAGPMWVHALTQDEGRGRAGRDWVSELGNLHASLLIGFRAPLEHGAQLSLVAGVAVADAIAAAAENSAVKTELGIEAQGRGRAERQLWLKWPNDIMIGANKCGGILVETSTVERGTRVASVIGIGLNLAVAPRICGREVTCLREHGLEVGASEILGHIDRSMLVRLGQWNRGAGFDVIRRAWLEMAGDIGSCIAVHKGANVLKGTFEGLSCDGHLIVRLSGGGVTEVAWGDVTFS